MSQSQSHYNPALNVAKFLLIVGVVLVHCNLFIPFDFASGSDYSRGGYWFVEFVSTRLTAICVPGFFMISGYLFFRNCQSFGARDWVLKLKSRTRSLLIPYLLWNALGCVLTLVKAKWLGFPSNGVIDETGINMLRLLEGFVDFSNGTPYAFAFWFIRNLILFVIVSPVAWLLARNKWIFAILILTLCATDFSPYGFEYFIIGAFFGIHNPLIVDKIKRIPAAIGLVVWTAGELLTMLLPIHYGIETLNILCSLGAMAFLMRMADKIASHQRMADKAASHQRMADNMASHRPSELLKLLVSSTFFIYAVHQFFCTVTINFYNSVFSLETFADVCIAYLCTFLTLISIPVLIWLLLRRLSPRLTSILSGGR